MWVHCICFSKHSSHDNPCMINRLWVIFHPFFTREFITLLGGEWYHACCLLSSFMNANRLWVAPPHVSLPDNLTKAPINNRKWVTKLFYYLDSILSHDIPWTGSKWNYNSNYKLFHHILHPDEQRVSDVSCQNLLLHLISCSTGCKWSCFLFMSWHLIPWQIESEWCSTCSV